MRLTPSSLGGVSSNHTANTHERPSLTSMGPDSLSQELADDSETILNLERTFRHPAGLQTARLIVRSLLAKQRSTQASLTNEMASSLPSIIDSSSNSEVAALLNQILAINDSQTETPDQRLLGAHINSYQSHDIEAPLAACKAFPSIFPISTISQCFEG